MKVQKHNKKRYLLGVVAMCTGALATFAQMGNHVFEGAEKVNYGTIDLGVPGDSSWSTFRGAEPGYFSAVGEAVYINAADTPHVDGYVKHYANAADQSFAFPVGSGTDYRALGVSGTRTATSEIGVAWIAGDPSGNLDPTGPDAGAHNVTSFGTGITKVSPVGQWDWQDLSSDAAGSTVSVSIPDMSAFDVAENLRLVGWDGTEWVNLSGTTGASANTENADLSGTMIAGITAIGIGAGELRFDFSDGTAFSAVRAQYVDANNDGTPDGVGSVWLGASVSADLADASNATATGDATGDDGFTTPPLSGGSIDHTVTLSAAGASTVFYSVRMVYSGTNGGSPSSGTIDLAGSHTFTAAGSQAIILSPAALVDFVGTIDYRVVAASSSADAAAAITGTSFINGEIEDYQRIYTSPLPVELIEQKAVWSGADVEVTWSTASELNNERFEIFRSLDGLAFELAGTVGSQAAGGNSNAILDYRFVDAAIANSVDKRVYYQIRQFDFDGANEHFDVMSLHRKGGSEAEGNLVIYPNPNKTGRITVSTSNVSLEGSELTIVSLFGQQVMEKEVFTDNAKTASVDVSTLNSGVYYVTITNGSYSKTTKLIIQ